MRSLQNRHSKRVASLGSEGMIMPPLQTIDDILNARRCPLKVTCFRRNGPYPLHRAVRWPEPAFT